MTNRGLKAQLGTCTPMRLHTYMYMYIDTHSMTHRDLKSELGTYMYAYTQTCMLLPHVNNMSCEANA